MKQYDYIIVGSGISGLLLINQLIDSQKLSNKQILIIDSMTKYKNDRVISFWSQNKPEFLESIEHHSWDKIYFKDINNTSRSLLTGSYTFYSFDSINFYNYILEKISHAPNVTIVHEHVCSIVEKDDKAEVRTINNSIFFAEIVFDSRFEVDKIQEEVKNNTKALLHFVGLKFTIPADRFDTSAPIFVDLRNSGNDNFCFFHLLPFAPNKASVNFISIAEKTHTELDTILKAYLQEQFGIVNLQSEINESGVLLLTDHKFTRQISHHVYTIGTEAGMIKPSTGYGFIRMYEDSVEIVKGLEEGSMKFRPYSDFYRKTDSLFLNLILHNPKKGYELFRNIFDDESIEYFLKFLDEKADYLEIWKLMSKAPTWEMLRQLPYVR